MSGGGVLPGLWPIPGDGVLARQGDLVLLIHPAGGALTDRLLDLLARTARAGQGGPRFADLVWAEFDADADAAGAAGAGHGPAAVAFGPAGGGTAVTVYGTAWAEVTTTRGMHRLTAGQPYGRLRCILPSAVTKVRAGVRAAGDQAGTDPYLRLAGGIVRAVGLVYAPGDAGAEAGAADPAEQAAAEQAAAEQAAAEQAAAERAAAERAAAEQAAAEQAAAEQAAAEWAAAAQAAEQAAALAAARAGQAVGGPGDGRADVSSRRDFISLSLDSGELGGDVPRRGPLPLGPGPPDEEDAGAGGMLAALVEGVYCKNGHFDDPQARYCAVCGISMGQLTKVRQKGRRPPLGVLVLADGSVCQLDADYVMGREPALDASVADGRARPLRLSRAPGVVSRIHARVELDGWGVFICDLNSANGTQVILPEDKNGTVLQPGVRTPLAAGAQIRLGGEYGLRYDSHRHR